MPPLPPPEVQLSHLAYDALGRSAHLSVGQVHPRGYPNISRLCQIGSYQVGSCETTLIQVKTQDMVNYSWDIYINGNHADAPQAGDNPASRLQFIAGSENRFLAPENRVTKTNKVHVKAPIQLTENSKSATDYHFAVKMNVTSGGDTAQYSEHPYENVRCMRTEYAEVITGDLSRGGRLNISFRVVNRPDATPMAPLPAVPSLGHGGSTPSTKEWMDSVQLQLRNAQTASFHSLSVNFRFVQEASWQGECVPRLYDVVGVYTSGPPATVSSGRYFDRVNSRKYVIELAETQQD